jgi:hypothetical protein
LSRLPDSGDEAACGSYEALRREATILKTSAPTTDHGIAIRVTSAPGAEVQFLQLVASDAASQRINATLRAEFEEALLQHYECGEYVWSKAGLDHADARWLVVHYQVSWYCGGPYPGYGYAGITYDRRTGEEVDASNWIEGEYGISDALAERIALKVFGPGGLRAGDEEGADSCREVYDYTRHYLAWPSSGGLTLLPDLPHATQACAEELELSIAEVEPFLTPAGRDALLPTIR